MATVNVRPMMLRSALRQLLEQRAAVVLRHPEPMTPDDARELAAYLARSREIQADIERQIAECA